MPVPIIPKPDEEENEEEEVYSLESFKYETFSDLIPKIFDPSRIILSNPEKKEKNNEIINNIENKNECGELDPGFREWIVNEGISFLKKGKNEFLLYAESELLGLGMELLRMGDREEIIYEAFRKSKSLNNNFLFENLL